jgi:glutathione S-transferase
MQLYHFPSPNPQKVTFALKELGLDCELVPVDLAKGEQRQPAFLAKNPFGRVPILVDGDLTLPESHAILEGHVAGNTRCETLPRSPMTLGFAAAAGFRLIVWCNACQHQIEPDP